MRMIFQNTKQDSRLLETIEQKENVKPYKEFQTLYLHGCDFSTSSINKYASV